MTTTQPTTQPPDVDLEHDDGDGPDPDMARVTVHAITADNACYHAGVDLVGDRAHDPEKWVDALLHAATAAAGMLGPDYAMALYRRRLAAHDGQASR